MPLESHKKLLHYHKKLISSWLPSTNSLIYRIIWTDEVHRDQETYIYLIILPGMSGTFRFQHTCTGVKPARHVAVPIPGISRPQLPRQPERLISLRSETEKNVRRRYCSGNRQNIKVFVRNVQMRKILFI